jgi:hypothetical protein
MAISVNPSEPRATIDICQISVSGADYARDPDKTGGEFRYYLEAEPPAGADFPKTLKSHEFDVSHDGDHVWDNVIFPEDGEWTVYLRDAADDSDVESQAVTVS